MFRIALFIFIFLKSNIFAEDIKCNFEEIYNDGSVQEGYILIKNDKLRYQYQDEKLFTIFYDGNNFYSVNNSNKSIVNKITENVEILEEIILLAKNYPNINSEYNKEEFLIKLEKSSFNNFYKRISIISQNIKLSIFFYNCSFANLDNRYFRFRSFLELNQ
jgi:outer membrane lipoprotein-sorting protein